MTSSNPFSKNVAPSDGLKPAGGHENLTSRELLVLDQIVKGHSSKEIALVLDISPRTVEFHRANLLSKYGAKNTADLVRKALADSQPNPAPPPHPTDDS